MNLFKGVNTDPDIHIQQQSGGVLAETEGAELGVLEGQIKDLPFHNPETGFFIATLVVNGDLPPTPLEWEILGIRPSAQVVTIKGTSLLFQGAGQVGLAVRCHGQWVLHEKRGAQFEVQFLQDVLPTTADMLRKYLASGQLKGIGPSTADAMVDRWGMDVLRILDVDPMKLTEIPRLKEEKVKVIAEAWRQKRELYALMSFLVAHGMGEAYAIRIRDHFSKYHWGQNIKELEDRIRKNPYLLTEVEGIGFTKADKVAMSLGVPKNSPLRLSAALLHNLKEKVRQDGHTAIPATQWIKSSAMQLSRPVEEVKQMCQELINKKLVVLRDLEVVENDQVQVMGCVSPTGQALAERHIATEVKRLISEPPKLTLSQYDTIKAIMEDPMRRLDPSQKKALWTVFQHSMSVLTGGPGTGKTTTLRSIVAAAQAIGLNVVLAAPTGRAAKRMEEAIDVPAQTMHRKLKYTFGQGFAHGSHHPLQGDLFVVDEASMVDTQMAKAWLSAIPSGAMVLWVGDADQLPAVQAGDVLRDFIQSQVIPVSRLTQVHRQAAGSAIGWNAQLVLQGKTPEMSGNVWQDDFVFIPAEDNAVLRHKMMEVIQGLINQNTPAQDIQILSPQKNYDCGTDSLNELFRELLNDKKPSKQQLEKHDVVVGERLMQIKNNYDLDVFNGDIGVVKNMDEDGTLWLEMEDSREDNPHIVKFNKFQRRELVLAYARTVHKSQGGEHPVVIMPISKSHSFSMNRNLLYTAITRGKKKVILIGDPRTLVLGVKKKNQLIRTTGLLNEFRVVGLKVPGPASANVIASKQINRQKSFGSK